MKLKITLTKHARERMAQRGVSLEVLRKTLDSPTATFPIASDRTQEFRREVGNRINYVVIQHKGKREAIVITTGWS